MNVKFKNLFKYLVLVVVIFIVCIGLLELGAQSVHYIRHGKFQFSYMPLFHKMGPVIPIYTDKKDDYYVMDTQKDSYFWLNFPKEKCRPNISKIESELLIKQHPDYAKCLPMLGEIKYSDKGNCSFRYPMKINSWGLRGAPPSKKSHVKNLLVLGGSSTLGVYNPGCATYPFLLEGFLKNNGHDIRVVNAGMGAAGTREMLFFLKDHINKFKIDGIILNSYYNFVSLFGQDSTFITENCNKLNLIQKLVICSASFSLIKKVWQKLTQPSLNQLYIVYQQLLEEMAQITSFRRIPLFIVKQPVILDGANTQRTEGLYVKITDIMDQVAKKYQYTTAVNISTISWEERHQGYPSKTFQDGVHLTNYGNEQVALALNQALEEANFFKKNK